MRLSIVATMYRSSESIAEFVRRAFESADALFDDVEMVLVNDGSPDDSLEKALTLRAEDPRIVLVDLSRNFGHHKAIMTGLRQASGDLIFLIDSDLEEEPELLPQFYERFRQGDCDVVYGVQIARKGGLFERLSGYAFFWAANGLGDQRLPANSITARLMTRDYVRALIRHKHREFTLGHLFILTGFRQVQLVVRKLSISPTTYSLGRRFDMAVRYLTTNSTKLLYTVLVVGMAVSSLSGLAIAYLILEYLFTGIHVDGWTSVITSVWFFGGLTTLVLGILGIYIANILAETKRGPYTVVRKIYKGVDRPQA